LFLLDFFLFSVLAFNYLYLRFLKKKEIAIKFPNMVPEDQPFFAEIKAENLPHFSCSTRLKFKRFTQDVFKKFSFLYFAEKIYVNPFSFDLRGEYQLVEMSLSLEFPFPLFQLRLSVKESATLLVAPCPSNKPIEIPLNLARTADQDEDLARLRPYVPGDARKMISWKHYAKLGELFVKEFEKSTKQQISFSLNYTESEEKAVIRGALCLFLNKMEMSEPFMIYARNSIFRFDGHSLNYDFLLGFLAKYQPPKNQPIHCIKLGSL